MAAVIINTGKCEWTSERNAVTALSNATLTATAGIAVPGNLRADTVHLVARKNATVTVKLHGYHPTIANWAQIGTVVFNEAGDEGKPLQGVSGYTRLQTSTNAIGTNGSVNIWFGFGGE